MTNSRPRRVFSVQRPQPSCQACGRRSFVSFDSWTSAAFLERSFGSKRASRHEASEDSNPCLSRRRDEGCRPRRAAAPADASGPSFNSVEALVRLLMPENRRVTALIHTPSVGFADSSPAWRGSIPSRVPVPPRILIAIPTRAHRSSGAPSSCAARIPRAVRPWRPPTKCNDRARLRTHGG